MSENVADTWEDLEDSDELDRKLNKLVVDLGNADEDMDVNKSNQAPGILPWLQDDSSGRTTYQPIIRILKREPTASNSNSSNHGLPSRPIRTLQEREAAYAEARLRILGSATSPEDASSTEDGYSILEAVTPLNSQSNNSSVSPVSSLPVVALAKDASQVLRQPRGPDGTSGFSVRQ